MKKKQQVSLLLVLIAIAFVLVAGCTSPTQSNVAPANLTENTSSSTSTTTSRSVSPTLASSTSPSASVKATPSSSPTSSPAPSSGKIATTVDGNNFFNADNTVTRGSPVTTWAFSVTAQGRILCGVPLTAAIDGRPAGTLTPQASSGCFQTANYGLSAQETSSLSAGTHTLTLSFAGDNTYQPTKQDFQIEVT